MKDREKIGIDIEKLATTFEKELKGTEIGEQAELTQVKPQKSKDFYRGSLRMAFAMGDESSMGNVFEVITRIARESKDSPGISVAIVKRINDVQRFLFALCCYFAYKLKYSDLIEEATIEIEPENEKIIEGIAFDFKTMHKGTKEEKASSYLIDMKSQRSKAFYKGALDFAMMWTPTMAGLFNVLLDATEKNVELSKRFILKLMMDQLINYYKALRGYAAYKLIQLDEEASQ